MVVLVPLVVQAAAINQANLALIRNIAMWEAREGCTHRIMSVFPSPDGLASARKEWDLVTAIWPNAWGQARQNVLLHLATSDWDEAEAAIEIADDPISLLRSAWLSASQGHFVDSSLKLARYNSDSLQILLRKGWHLFNQGEYEEALVCFEVAVPLDTTSAETLIARGRTRQMLDYHLLALTDFNKAIARCPGCYQAYLFRGSSWLESGLGNAEQIEADFRRAVTLAPEQYEAVIALGYWLRDQGHWVDAEVQLQKAVLLKPREIAPILSLADIYCTSHRHEEAIRLLEVAQIFFTSPHEAEKIHMLLNKCSED